MIQDLHYWLNDHLLFTYSLFGIIGLSLIAIFIDWDRKSPIRTKDEIGDGSNSRRKSPMMIIGSVLVLIVMSLAFFLGLFVDMILTIFTSQGDFLSFFGSMGILIFCYSLVFVNLILAIVSFFRNTGMAILIVSIIMILLYVLGKAPLNIILSFLSIIGGILITLGYRRA